MKLINAAIIVTPQGAPIYDERATRVEIEDEGAGAFVVVSQERGRIAIDAKEWPAIQRAIDTMMAQVAELDRDEAQADEQRQQRGEREQ